jgi:hypothetical protein
MDLQLKGKRALVTGSSAGISGLSRIRIARPARRCGISPLPQQRRR